MEIDSRWDRDAEPVTHKDFKPITTNQLHQLGIKGTLTKVSTLEELRETSPNIVIGDCVKYIRFVQNRFKQQELLKKSRYVMALGVYQQLHYIPENHNVRILKPSNVKFRNIYKPYLGQDLTNKTLLVSRTGGIGDLLFIKPNLNFLKEKYPSCNINFCCGPQYQPMIDTWDCVDNLLDLPFSVSYLFKADYHAIFEGVIERCKEAENTNAYSLFSRWLKLDLPDDLLIPKQEAKPEKVEECKEILKTWGLDNKPFFIAQIRASSPIRTPRPNFWMKIFNALTNKGYNILITDSPHQSDNIDKLIQSLENQEKVFNFCQHSPSIDYTIAIVSLSQLSISTDTALIHIAQSLGVPGFGMYGPFPAFVRLKTYKNVDWVEGKCEDSPCFLHGRNPCPRNVKGYGPCYDTINVEEVVEKVGRLINV